MQAVATRQSAGLTVGCDNKKNGKNNDKKNRRKS
jgi:hypothetical protein